jgi:hypothetical protein
LPDRSWIFSGWAALRGKAPAAPAHLQEVADLGVATGFGSARLGIDDEGLPQLLLPVAQGAKLPRGNGPPLLRALLVRLADRDGARSYLVVTCLDRRLERGFADLVESVLGRVQAGDGSLAAYTSAVEDFRALFTQVPRDRVEEWRIRGLVAELLQLERLVTLDPRAVQLWFGPDRDRHDFRGGQDAIEVKSARRQGGNVTINGLEQLASPAGGSLLLRRYVLEPSPGGADSVAAIWRRLLAVGAPSSDLLDRLKAMECPDPDAPGWNQVAFNLEGSDTFRVADGFPRLTRSSFAQGVPAGVSDVTYAIDLGQAAHFTVGDAELQAFETALVASLDA